MKKKQAKVIIEHVKAEKPVKVDSRPVTWLPASKAEGNHTVEATDITETRDGIVWVKCFYKG